VLVPVPVEDGGHGHVPGVLGLEVAVFVHPADEPLLGRRKLVSAERSSTSLSRRLVPEDVPARRAVDPAEPVVAVFEGAVPS
jgi:hypothetical protein